MARDTLESQIDTPETDHLVQALLSLKNKKEMKAFLRDLLTWKEIKEFSQRLQVARMLQDGQKSYREIAKETGVSTTTITRINDWLQNGMGGYQLVLKRLR